ncbi:MAG: hypothetical protein BGO67_12295 [Alphaproteobacteria bacterium 41-28]|nr:MAG: hypothetical protein BGO67_12295 [Alphaproteobacteria bacterium 41-28]
MAKGHGYLLTPRCHPWQEKVALAKARAYLFLAEDLSGNKILGQEMLEFSFGKLSISYQG